MAQGNAASRTIGAVLNTVGTAADTITSTFQALGTGATMLNRYATDASQDQADASLIHRQVYRSNLVTQSALEQNKLQVEVNAHLAANPSEAAGFEAVHTQLSQLFATA